MLGAEYKNSSWVIFAKILYLLISVCVNAYLTRYLGVDLKGEMADAQAISSFWCFISSFGLFDVLISRFSNRTNNSGMIAATGMFMMFVGGMLAFFLSVISSYLIGSNGKIFRYVIILSLAYFFQFFSVFECWFYSNSISKKYAIAQSVIHFVFCLFNLFGVICRLNIYYFLFVIVLENILIFCSSYFCYRLSDCHFTGKFIIDIKEIKLLLRLAVPMIITGFATSVYMKVDQIMVGKMLGSHELGLYSVAVNLAEYWYFVPAAIYSSFISKFNKQMSEKQINDRLQQFSDIMIVIGYFAVICVLFLGKIFIKFLYGVDFIESYSILIVYIWTGIFTCISFSGQIYYIVRDDTKTIMYINVIGSLLNFALNIYLLKKFGILGAAFATLIEYSIVTFGQMIILRNKYRILYIIQLKAFFPFFRLAKVIKQRYFK